MDNNILKGLLSQLGDQELDIVSNKLGVNKSQASSALQGVLPTLISAMANNAGNQKGAMALDRALEKDHDGSILDNLSGFLNNAESGPGNGILKHLLGTKRGQVEQNLGQKTGLSSGNISQLLQIAAPIVMAYLGKQKRTQGLDAGILGSLLQGAAGQAQQDSEFDLSDVVGMLAGGSSSSRGGLAGMAMKVLGGFLGKK